MHLVQYVDEGSLTLPQFTDATRPRAERRGGARFAPSSLLT